MRKRVGILAVLAVLAVVVVLGARRAHWVVRLEPRRVAVLELNGEIVSALPMVRDLRRFGRTPGVGAVVVALDTPGGGVAASQEICQEILRLRKRGIKVVAAMGGMAASGGYYVASSCDEIVADPGTVTGSIGVILDTVEFGDLMRRFGVRPEVVKSGEFKDAGSPFRAMTPRDRAVFQATINDVYDQFISNVASWRAVPLARAMERRRGGPGPGFTAAQVKAYVRSLADGRIYTGRMAYRLGLVDTLGGLQDAIVDAGALAGLKNPEVVTYRRQKSLAEMFTGMDRARWSALLRETFSSSAPRLSYSLR